VRVAALTAVLAVAVTAGCGGSDGSSNPTTSTSEASVLAPSWAASLLGKPGPEGALVMSTADYGPGENRVGFLLVGTNGALIAAPKATLYYRPVTNGPTRAVPANKLPIGVRDRTGDEVPAIWAARLRFPQAGKYWIVIQPQGTRFQGFQILDVQERSKAPALGQTAPASENPTTASRPAAKITTARPPDTALLRYTVADSLEQHVPFVVVFATPEFCQTRTCGPTVEVVDAVRKRFERRGIRFIHIEVYEDNNPAMGVNRWMREWSLPSEPWVFVVGADGMIRDRFEGAVSVIELERAVRDHLSG
jgi:hypothetical protein